MAEKKGVGHAYNVDFLNVVFAASSIFLLLTTVWMVWDDFDREWKGTQRRFNQLQIFVVFIDFSAVARVLNSVLMTARPVGFSAKGHPKNPLSFVTRMTEQRLLDVSCTTQ